ncbi:MAG: crotonase/enoyl-CoA hydratase family protein [Rhodothalassiaceae bacterium]
MPFDPPHSDLIALTLTDKIAHVELNRPDKRNALPDPFWTEFPALIDWLSEQPEVRCILLSGRGKMFTAGLDLNDAASLFQQQGDPGRVREKLRRKIAQMQDCVTALERCRVPVIAAVHDGCLGAGVDLASACCVRLATRDAYFTVQEINIGIVADVGTLQRLPALLPLGLVRELAYTGRPFRAEEALAHGFVNAVLDDREALLAHAFDLARQIAAKSPLAMAGTKRAITYARDHGAADALTQVADWNAGMLLGTDVMKAVQAVLRKQQADFDDLLP